MAHDLVRRLLVGAAAGAAGTTALNAVTYIDMAVRGRPASSTPEQSVEHLSDSTGVDIPGDEETRGNRVQGLGPLIGLATGTGVGALYGLVVPGGRSVPVGWGTVLAAATALVAANGPMAALGLSDPRQWSASDWASDLVPHAAYGLVTAATYAAATNDGRS
jgi:hypothetical protein